ncbi:unnamed protein product [Amaranthus hypochondriacus]
MIIIIFFVLLSLCSGLDGRSTPEHQTLTTIEVSRPSDEKSSEGEKSRSIKKLVHSNGSYISLVPADMCSAIIRTKPDPNKKFLGIEGTSTLYKPSVIGDSQWSKARMKLLNGPDIIEVGWMVNPSVFKDNEAHLYVQFTAGSNGCINTECTGFVHVAKDYPLGATPKNYSVIGIQPYSWNFRIAKQDDGNWWVFMGEQNKKIGYWPKTLFTGLAEVANQAEWGGEVGVYPEKSTNLPGMGSGLKAGYDVRYSAMYMHLKVFNSNHANVDPEDTQEFVNCDRLYTLIDFGHKGPIFERIISYGGPTDYNYK